MMTRLLNRARSSQRESGFTLIEALVAMVIFGVAMSAMTSVVAAMTQNMRQAQGVSESTDQTRLAFQRLDKQLRYSNGIVEPGPGAGGSYFEASLVNPRYNDNSGAAHLRQGACVQWRLLYPTGGQANGMLQMRQWETAPVSGTPIALAQSNWITVATGLTNTTSPFTLNLGERHQELVVDFYVMRRTKPRGTAQVTSSFFARNTGPAATPTGLCARTRS